MLPADQSPSFELLRALYMLEKEKYSRSSLLAPMLKRMPWLQLVNRWICQIGFNTNCEMARTAVTI